MSGIDDIIKQQESRDESDRCKECGCLLRIDLSDTRTDVMIVVCSNEECQKSKKPRTIKLR